MGNARLNAAITLRLSGARGHIPLYRISVVGRAEIFPQLSENLEGVINGKVVAY